MAEVIPAILPKNYEDLKNRLALVKGIVPMVQVDLCDGIFVPNKTWPFAGDSETDINFRRILNEEEGLPFWEEVDFELDLMVADAVENFDLYMKLGVKRVVFHIEAIKDPENFKEFLEGIDPYVREMTEIGIAINPTTELESIFPIISLVDFVQCMAIGRIGYQGEPFHVGVLDYIKILKEKFPDMVISVDGGVNPKTAPRLLSAGADRLVVGSAIFNSDDIIGTIEEFKCL